jgi:hypothetical protein
MSRKTNKVFRSAGDGDERFVMQIAFLGLKTAIFGILRGKYFYEGMELTCGTGRKAL